MWLMGMLLIKRNWTSDREKIERIFHVMKKYRLPVWIISYLEGTRVTTKKIEEVKRFIHSFIFFNYFPSSFGTW